MPREVGKIYIRKLILMARTFHSELTTDSTVHRCFLGITE